MYNFPIVTIKNSKTPQLIYDDLLSSYSNKTYCTGGVDGLQILEQSPAHVVIIETETDDLSGLEIADAIREIDDDANHFTYIIIVGEQPVEDVINSNVDAHIPQQRMHSLTHLVSVGCRLANQIKSLQELNTELRTLNQTIGPINRTW